MAKFIASATIYFVAFAVTFTGGSAVSPEDPDQSEIIALNAVLPEDVNLTEVELALRLGHPHERLNVVSTVWQ